MKVAIAGAGAMGSRFGLMLSQGGVDVTLIDGWKEHINAIREHGLQANYNGEDVTVKLPVMLQAEVGRAEKFDLVVVFTKSMQLAQMLHDIQGVLGEQTKVLCLLNGLGHVETLEKYVQRDNIFLGNTMWTAGLTGPGKVKLFGSGSVELENVGDGKQDDAKQLAEFLSASGLNASYSDNILYSIYRKACVNGTMNCLTTLLDCNMGQFGATSTAHQIVVTIVKEFAAVAKVEKIDLDVDELIAHVESCYDPSISGHYPSMYQDLIQNKRKTEIDYINGAISRKGHKYGVPTPYCDLITEMIHAKEELLGAK